MKTAMFNVKILLQKNSVTADKIGNRKNQWTDFYSCFAYVSGENSAENIGAETISDNSEIIFTVRYCNKISDINPVNYRVVFYGEIYNIIGIDHMNFKKKTIKIKCRKERKILCQPKP